MANTKDRAESPDAYQSAGGGKLKLKGAKDSRIDKRSGKKTKKNHTKVDAELGKKAERYSRLDDLDEVMAATKAGAEGTTEGKTEDRAAGNDLLEVGQTEAERKHEETRRRRLNDRIVREGIKTHKERVEELNKYLSTLSEHHDMPRIGPG